MKMIAVTSTNVQSVGYDDASAILRVAFVSGSVYEYLSVPRSIFDALLAASSKGRFLDLNVKKAGYAWRQVS